VAIVKREMSHLPVIKKKKNNVSNKAVHSLMAAKDTDLKNEYLA